MVILFRSCGVLSPKNLNYLSLHLFDYERRWWTRYVHYIINLCYIMAWCAYIKRSIVWYLDFTFTREFVPLTHIYYHALSWLGTGIRIKSGEVNSFILFYVFIYIWEILTFWSEKVVIKYFINKSHNYKISVLLISWFNCYQTNVPTLKASYRIPKQKRPHIMQSIT